MYALEDICNQHAGGDSQLDAFMTSLPLNQGGGGRHKCPYCAFYKGYEIGFQSSVDISNGFNVDFQTAGIYCKIHRGGVSHLEDVMTSLLYNQGGEGRHRCPYCSYLMGLKAGFNART